MPDIQETRQESERHQSRAGRTNAIFLKRIEESSGLPRERAAAAAISVLCRLERRILAGEARNMEAQLPSRLRDIVSECTVHAGEKPERIGAEEFVKRVAQDLECQPAEAESIVRSVFCAVRDHISEGEAEEVMGELPPDLREYWRRPS